MKPLVSPLQQAIDFGAPNSLPAIVGYPYPGMSIVGTCSACGGPMLIPEMWAGTPEVFPRPRCADCGREKKAVAKWGPVIEVE